MDNLKLTPPTNPSPGQVTMTLKATPDQAQQDPAQNQKPTSQESKPGQSHTNPNPQPSGGQSASSGFSNEHLKDVGDLIGDDPAANGAGPSQFVSHEEFANIFCIPFQVSRGVIAARTGHELDALNISPKTQGASDAAKACFELIKAVPSLHMLIRRDSGALMHGVILGSFVVNIGQAARAELINKEIEARRIKGNDPDAPQPDAPQMAL